MTGVERYRISGWSIVAENVRLSQTVAERQKSTETTSSGFHAAEAFTPEATRTQSGIITKVPEPYLSLTPGLTYNEEHC